MPLHLLGNEPSQWKVYILECKNSNLKTFLSWNSLSGMIKQWSKCKNHTDHGYICKKMLLAYCMEDTKVNKSLWYLVAES